jgi:hypothetical protein
VRIEFLLGVVEVIVGACAHHGERHADERSLGAAERSVAP